jgi:predicted HAD superfamily Cof-like phosphohydrolase
MNELQRTLNWFQLAVPTPTDKNKSVQIGCFFEEVSEVVEALGDYSSQYGLISDMARDYKTYEGKIYLTPQQRLELLDGLCDTIVTAVGVAHMFDMDIMGAMSEVNRSNFSKFVDGKPVFNEQGKIAKPATYSAPSLEKFV